MLRFISRPSYRQVATRSRSTSLIRSSFNEPIRESDQTHRSLNPVGLFGTRLRQPSDFSQLAKETIRNSQEIVNRIESTADDASYRVHTIRDFDLLSDTICRLIDVAELVRNVHPDPKWIQAADETFQNLGNFMSQLNTHFALYESVCRYLDQFEGRGERPKDELIVARMFKADFQKSGIHLSASTRREFIDINDKINNLSHQFSSDAFSSTKQDKNEVLEELLYWRSKTAKLLGKESFASYFLQDKMAKSPENVLKFLKNFDAVNRPLAQREVDAIRRLKYNGSSDSKLAVGMYDRNSFGSISKSDSYLRPYLSVGSVLQAISELFQRLYGVTLEPVTTTSGEVWDPSVRRLDVIHETEGKIATIYCDLFRRLPRSGTAPKCPVPAQFTVRCARRIDWDNGIDNPDLKLLGTFNDKSKRAIYQLPVVVISCPFDHPTERRPTLLSWHESESLFHEFGHAIHSALARTNFQHVAGTRCMLDIVETPSILMEYMMRHPDVLRHFRHYETDKPLSSELISQHVKALNAPQAFAALDAQQQIFFATVDQCYHSLTAEQLENKRNYVKSLYRDIYKKVQVLSPELDHSQPSSFTHLSVYGGGYYSYLWCRMIAQDLFKHHFQIALNHDDPEKLRLAGDVFRQEMLGFGGGIDPWDIRWDRLLDGRSLPDCISKT